MKDLHAEGEIVGNLALQQPTREPVILVAGAWVNPITATAVSGLFSEILLHPNRQEFLRVASTQPT